MAGSLQHFVQTVMIPDNEVNMTMVITWLSLYAASRLTFIVACIERGPKCRNQWQEACSQIKGRKTKRGGGAAWNMTHSDVNYEIKQLIHKKPKPWRLWFLCVKCQVKSQFKSPINHWTCFLISKVKSKPSDRVEELRGSMEAFDRQQW